LFLLFFELVVQRLHFLSSSFFSLFSFNLLSHSGKAVNLDGLN
jgi:hypothetical protein